MYTIRWRSLLLLLAAALLLLSETSSAFDPLTVGGLAIAGAAGTLITAWQAAKCRLWECCAEPWLTTTNMAASSGRVLRKSLEDRVYGQHIAIDMVTENIRHHLSSKPSKPLVLSFHGGTGVGKNHMTKILAETMFKKGMKSKFVHLIISTLHFPHSTKTEEYRVMIQSWIRGNLSECSRNLFIFDEVDKIPVGVLDGLSSFLEYYGTKVDGVDPRAAIFVFLSNTGASRIDEITYRAWEAGKKRESLTIFDFQKALEVAAFNEKNQNQNVKNQNQKHEKNQNNKKNQNENENENEKNENVKNQNVKNEVGGLYRSNVISHQLIDIFIPFLPLERRHVEACVRDYLRERNFTMSEEVVEIVANELEYFPEEDAQFSSTGCKRIRERVVGHTVKLLRLAEKVESNKIEAKEKTHDEETNRQEL